MLLSKLFVNNYAIYSIYFTFKTYNKLYLL